MTSLAPTAVDLVGNDTESVALPASIPIERTWSLGRLLLLSLVFTYLALVLLFPLAALLGRALDAGLSRIISELSAADALRGLAQSLVLAVIAVVANGMFGIAGALVLVRQRFIGRQVLDALVDLSLAVSPVITGLAFLLVFGRNGWLQPVLDALNISVAFAFPGLVICTVFVTLPFTLREVSYVLEEIGTDEEEVAATLGASAWTTFWRVTLPNVRHGLSLGVTLTTARALGEFGAVLVVGGAISGKTQTATTFIYAASEERQEAVAFGMALVLAVLSMLLLVVLERLKNRGKTS
jgi:sulfate transport system permease protein